MRFEGFGFLGIWQWVFVIWVCSVSGCRGCGYRELGLEREGVRVFFKRDWRG